MLAALRELAPDDGWERAGEVSVATHDRAGTGRVESLNVQSQSTVLRTVILELNVEWANGGDPMAMSTGGYSAEELVAVSMRVGMLQDNPPESLGMMGGLVNTDDPFAELQHVAFPEGSLQAVARLFIVERLIGARQASLIERFSLGPVAAGRRRTELTWRDAQRYANATPESRSVEGDRSWG